MGRRAIFLDVDGTYVNDRGLVPESAARAVVLARANGHQVFLCTGRSMAGLTDHILEAGFDGVIASAGRYVEVAGQVLIHSSLPVDDVRRVLEFLDRHRVDYYLEADGGFYGSAGIEARMREVVFGGVTDPAVIAQLEKGIGGLLAAVAIGEDLLRHDINTIVFMDSDLPLTAVQEEFRGLDVTPASVRAFGRNAGEISAPGLHKASAIEVLIGHLGIAWEDTLAYGDGVNDLEMIEYVHTGVAMGNAHPDVRAVANAVTGGPDQDGIYRSFTHLGLI